MRANLIPPPSPEPVRIQDEELASHLQRIDAQLASEGFTIPQRPMNAIVRLGTALKLSLPFSDPKGFQHESSVNWYVTEFIHQWYDTRYGERIKLDFSPGLIAIDIRGDIYVVRMPLVYGAARFYAHGEPNPKPTGHFSREPPRFNALDAIPDLTTTIRRELTEAELDYILQLFVLGVEVSHHFKGLGPKAELARLARADIDAAVTHLSDLRREYGLSKWSSLQATEKVFKHVITTTGQPFKHIHDLATLLRTTTAMGFGADVREAIDVIQCSPGVRYGEPTVSEIEALDAHHASLVVCRELLRWSPARP